MKNKSYYFLGFLAIGAAFVFMKSHHPATLPAAETPVSEEAEISEGAPAADDSSPKLPELPQSPTAFGPRAVSGSYLAARFAVSNDDLAAAAKFYETAIDEAGSKQDAEYLNDRSLPAAIGAGQIGNALEITRDMDLKQPTATAQLAVLVQSVEAFKHNNTAAVNRLLPLVRDDGFGRLLKPLLQAWGLVAEKKFDQAVATLNALEKTYPSLRPLVRMHLAFIYEVEGKNDAAESYYLQSVGDQASIRSAAIIGRFYERRGNAEKAAEVYRRLAKTMPGAPLPELVLDRLKRGDLIEKAFITTASDGVAAALYDVATVLHQENSSRLGVIYAQMAHYLAPQDEYVNLLLGDIVSNTKVATQAAGYFKSVPQNSDLYPLAQLRLSQLYEQEEDYDRALSVLNDIKGGALVKRQAEIQIADMYRRKEDFDAAIPYYNRIIDRLENPKSFDWVMFYSRGICYERTNQWDKAEADLQHALKLSPNQPEVLNYLAYSWADRGKNLQQSLEMLQKALAGAPDDPYISDSVGWALHKNGQHEEAARYLETSIQQLPEDPVINDHLGDIYWAVGRRLEAHFQWDRALKNAKATDKEFKASLQEKLAHGLQAADKNDGQG